MGMRRAAAAAAAWVSFVGAAGAQTPLVAEPVAGGLDALLFATHAPEDFARLLTVQQGGVVRVVKNGALLPEPYLDLSSIVQTGSEQGLLGLAFDPAYASSGHFYIHYTRPDDDTVIARYRVSTANPDVAEPSSAETVLVIPRDADYHNGGWLGFGPDGLLYIASGDGGTGCDPQSGPQSAASLLGKILRINVASLPYTIPAGNPFAGGGGRGEIWANGLRNPWRCSFDRATGDLWVGDVGQGSWEEVNLLAPGAPAPAAPWNFAWPCREGVECGCTNAPCPGNCESPAFIDPVHAYSHAKGCSITGGYVYRGCAIPDLHATYFFGDFCSGRIWSFRYTGGAVTGLTERTGELEPPGGWLIAGFGEDAYGEVYVCDYNGTLYRISPEAPVGPDCNNNGRRDACDIASGYSSDNNANGVPDECDCYPNCNASYGGPLPTLTIADFACFQTKFVAGHAYADCNGTGGLTIADFACFQTKFVAGCP